jgi:hypothetical protein
VINTVRKNLAPFYQMHLSLTQITSMNHLVEMCRTLERSKLSAESYRPPSTRNSMERDLSYRKIKSQMAVEPIAVATTSGRNRDEKSSSSKPSFACWKCDKIGHRAADCRSKSGVMCYRCKAPNVTLRTCPTSAEGHARGNKPENPRGTQ